jgi:hypothetical protein
MCLTCATNHGALSLREGKLEEGFAELRASVKQEDALRYDEPPGWLIPVRHSLGASLMQAGRRSRYIAMILHVCRKNGWALFGLAQSLRKQAKNDEEAAAADAPFRKVWAKAEVQITSSCLCQPGK